MAADPGKRPKADEEPSVIPCTCPDECCIHEPTDVVREGDARSVWVRLIQWFVRKDIEAAWKRRG